ncbi:ArnT family glycosyltransferase [Phormidesmis priestleyi]|uniref:ArnT family glycosyltransferase n=1 Tax=Phormidesmis priestleyi TaxID=268141 RepID=UPI00093463F0|nr:glycosyltransferase family 39 protein [Phormidesmis priestleyi]
MQSIQKKWSQAHQIHQLQRSVVWILGIGLAFRSMVAFWLPPGFDEAYYYIYTLHPAWSYFDHPPLVSLSTAFGVWLTGNVSPFTIRLGTLLLFTAALYFLYRATTQLFSQRAGILTLAIASIAPIFQIGFGILTLPDAPLMAFWSLTLWVAACEFFPQDDVPYRPSYRVAVIGLLVGLACLSKYHGVLLGVGLLGFCLTSVSHRAALRSPWILLSVALFTIAVSPVLYWNWQHDWVSFLFQSNRGIPAKRYNFVNVINTALIHSAYLFPTIGLPLWWVSLAAGIRAGQSTVRSWFNVSSMHLGEPPPNPQFWGRQISKSPRIGGFRGRDGLVTKSSNSHWFKPRIRTESELRDRQWLVVWVSVPAFLVFTLIGGYQQILPTWTMPGFFAATPLLGQQAALWQERHPKLVKRWLVGSAIAIVMLLLTALSHITLGTLQKPSHYGIFGGFLAPENDASISLVDIVQLRQNFAASPQLLAALKDADFVFSNRFHMAGHVGMALTPLAPIPVTCFDKKDVRGFAFWSTAEQWVGKDGLYLTSNKFQTEGDSAAEYAPYFQQFEKLGEVPLRRGGVIVDKFHVYRGKNLLKPYPRPSL